MSNPTITIAVPVHNTRQFVEDALRCILAQSFQDWELIAIADGCTDGSLDLLHRLRDPRVRVLSGPQCGIAARLNQIVRLARGPFLARMDSDDLMDPRRLQLQLDYLRAHPEVDGVGCSLLVLDPDLNPTGIRRLPTSHAEICRNPLRGLRLPHAAFLGRIEWFRQHAYNEQNRDCEDWELWLTSYRSSRFANHPEPLYFNREMDLADRTKYLFRKHILARRIREYGPRSFSRAKTALEAGRQYAHIAAYRMADAVGMGAALVRHRSDSLSAEQTQHYRALIAQLRQTPLPLAEPLVVADTPAVTSHLLEAVATALPSPTLPVIATRPVIDFS